MGRAGLISILGTTAALLALAAPVPCAAESWAPVVSKAGIVERALQGMVIPPTPVPKPAVKPAPAPAPVASVPAKKPSRAPNAAAAAGTDDITTGSVDAIQSTRMLSPEDSERLFSNEDATGSDDMTTGAVGGQGSDLARGYCVSIGGSAADARIAWQKAKLADVERELAKRIAVLEAKTNEYKAWVERRDQFLKRANETLVKIYTQMEPDAAAPQLASMDEETSAALLMKLEPQNASAILNEMPPDKAARLSATISGAARIAKPKPAAAAVPPVPPGPPPYGEAPERPTPVQGRS